MAAKQNQNKNDNRPVFALQIGHTKIRATIYRQDQGKIVEAETLEEQWQDGSHKIFSDEGKQGLKLAIRRVLSKVPRMVDEVYIALSGEYCVTRVVSDTNENVQHEVREIESRSSLYLSLGHGSKVVAGNILQQDPRHQHATVSVVHRQTIEAILEVTKFLNLKVISVEPAVISLCRLLGGMGLDRHAPVLLVCPGQSGVEIAISYLGRLFLSYRPAGVRDENEIAEIIVHHQQRLHRYCRRHARLMQESIQAVYLSGEPARTDSIRKQLGERIELPVRSLDSVENDNQVSKLVQTMPIAHYPAAGAGLLAIREFATPGPNLMERLRSDHDENLLSLALRVVGPLAAVIVLAVAIWGYLIIQRWNLQDNERLAAELEPTHRESIVLQGVMTQGRETLNMHKKISQLLPERNMANWLRQISSNVPEDAWLVSVAMDKQGDLTVEGNATNESSVFNYADNLRKLEFLNRATVDGAIPSNTTSGPAIKFTIHCDIDDWVRPGDQLDDSV